MIIVSQDRKKIINFDQIAFAEIKGAMLNNIGRYGIVFNTGNSVEYIAGYKTEKRAKEVLQEILENYKNLLDTYTYSDYMVYEMPLEE